MKRRKTVSYSRKNIQKYFPPPTLWAKLVYAGRQFFKFLHNAFLTVANARNGWRRIREMVTVFAC